MFRYIVSPPFSRAKNKLVANQVTMLPSRQVMAAEILLVLFSRSLDWLTDPQGVIVGALLDGEGYVKILVILRVILRLYEDLYKDLYTDLYKDLYKDLY